MNLRDEVWARRLAGLTAALHKYALDRAVDIMRREHPIGQLRTRGEISEIEYLAAMAYFAAVMTGSRIIELRKELSDMIGLNFSAEGCKSIEYRALDEFNLDECFRKNSRSLFDQFFGASRVRDATFGTILRAKLPDSAEEMGYLRLGLKLLPITLGVRACGTSCS